MTGFEQVGGGLTWGEGPRLHDGALWVSDTQGKRLWTDAHGTWRAHPLDSPSNGLWFLPDGRLAAAMMHERRVGVWNGTGFDTYADLADVAIGPLGDMTGDAAGGLYVDDVANARHDGSPAASGRLVRVEPNGEARVVAEDLEFPNGLAVVDEGRTLLIVETAAKRLSALDVESDGSLTGRRVVADLGALLGPNVAPDGLWPVDDGVWVATLTGHAVVKLRDGQVVDSIDTGERLPIACCSDGRRLIVTLADTQQLELMEAASTGKLRTSVVSVGLDATARRGD